MIVYDFVIARILNTFPRSQRLISSKTVKIDKKFTVFGDKYAFIIETNGNIYCYAKPVADSSSAAQYLIQLDDEEEVMGWAHESKEKELKEVLYLLTKKKIYKLEFNKTLGLQNQNRLSVHPS